MFGTFLSPLHPLTPLLGSLFAGAGTDEPDDLTRQPSATGHTDTITDEELDGGDPNLEPPEDDEPEDDDEEAPEELVRRNAARKITEQSDTMKADDLALISLLAEAPSKAPRVIAMLQESNPAQAQRLAKMFQNGDDSLAEKLKNADPVVRETLEGLVKTVESLTQRTEEQRQSAEARTFQQWQEKNAPELSKKSAEGMTPLGKRLRAEFFKALDLFPENKPLTDDMMADALAVAQRRVGWHAETVKQAVDRQAIEQARRARTGSAPRSGAGIRGNDLPNVDPSLAKEFGHDSKDRLQKVAEHKKRLLSS